MYIARDARGNAVTLKELVFRLIPSAAELRAFEREAEMLRQVDHPRIPRLVEVFREGEGADLRLYIVSAFVEGIPLDRLVEGGPLPLEEVLGIGREVLSLLSYLHGLSPKVLHRDIKPANLVRSAADGTTWLVDFGAARDLKLGVTYGTTMVGTYGYMAPEQLGGAASERSDLYAAGATLLHLVTGKAPTTILRAGKRVDLTRAGVPGRLHRLLATLLAEEPEKRPRSANEALRLLDAKPV